MGLKKTSILLIILLVAGIGIVISTVSNVSTYSDFDEAAFHPGKEFHIIGTLNTQKPVNMDITDEGSQFSFYMFDRNKHERKVIFKGEKPQDFEKTEQIVIIGRMSEELFLASSILLKCPSKYNKEGNDTEEEFKSDK